MMDGTVRIVKEHRKLMKIKARIVAPKTLIQKILHENHNTELQGHPSIEDTCFKISQMYGDTPKYHHYL